MSEKTSHSHASFISEWLNDTSRAIDVYRRGHSGYFEWQKTTIDFVLRDIKGVFATRFADSARKKHEAVSSLTDHELLNIVEVNNPSQDDINLSLIRAVANAAAQREHENPLMPQPAINKASLRPQNFNDLDVISPEEMEALYKNMGSKRRMF